MHGRVAFLLAKEKETGSFHGTKCSNLMRKLLVFKVQISTVLLKSAMITKCIQSLRKTFLLSLSSYHVGYVMSQVD